MNSGYYIVDGQYIPSEEGPSIDELVEEAIRLEYLADDVPVLETERRLDAWQAVVDAWEAVADVSTGLTHRDAKTSARHARAELRMAEASDEINVVL